MRFAFPILVRAVPEYASGRAADFSGRELESHLSFKRMEGRRHPIESPHNHLEGEVLPSTTDVRIMGNTLEKTDRISPSHLDDIFVCSDAFV